MQMNLALTVPSVSGRVDDSSRMGSEANKINTVFFAINCLETSETKKTKH